MPTEYKSHREDMASVIAQYTSGVTGAIPEQVDFDLADELLVLIDKRLTEE
jgi:hypothetical protein